MLLSHVLQMKEKLDKIAMLAQEHMVASQQHQKAWYDQAAPEREFHAGQRVLVMLPTDESKLLAKWQGPYKVTQKLGLLKILPLGKTVHSGNRPQGLDVAGEDKVHKQQNNPLVPYYAVFQV